MCICMVCNTGLKKNQEERQNHFLMNSVYLTKREYVLYQLTVLLYWKIFLRAVILYYRLYQPKMLIKNNMMST